jgi:hypothetical protein
MKIEYPRLDTTLLKTTRLNGTTNSSTVTRKKAYCQKISRIKAVRPTADDVPELHFEMRERYTTDKRDAVENIDKKYYLLRTRPDRQKTFWLNQTNYNSRCVLTAADTTPIIVCGMSRARVAVVVKNQLS